MEKNHRIIIVDYTYYDDVNGADQFEKHGTHFYDFIGDKIIIGKFCAIAKGIVFVINGMEPTATWGFIFFVAVFVFIISKIRRSLTCEDSYLCGMENKIIILSLHNVENLTIKPLFVSAINCIFAQFFQDKIYQKNYKQ